MPFKLNLHRYSTGEFQHKELKRVMPGVKKVSVAGLYTFNSVVT